ncbi:MAG: ArsC/Spx/MgsR family protein [Clostridia bacterium]
MLFIEYPKCSTCKNIKNALLDAGFSVETRNIVENTPTAFEIKSWHEKSKLDIKKFFNTSGLKYKELSLKDKLETMTLEEKYELLATDGMLIKRPLTIDCDNVYIAKDVLKLIK